MLEVCFNDSVKGALILAQHCEDNLIGGAVSVISNRKGLLPFFSKRKAIKEYRRKYEKLQNSAISLGGVKEDIIGVSFALSEGDIASSISLEECPRKKYLREQFLFPRYCGREDGSKDFEDFWIACIKDLEVLKSKPAQIRIWLGQTPDAQCGLLFIAHMLNGSGTEIHIVSLPEQIIGEDNICIKYRGWGEVEPQLFGTYLENETMLTNEETDLLAKQWEVLKQENAMLRVVENGIVCSADINYYDSLIKREFPESSCKVAFLIGSALGKQNILTSDVFIAKRVQHFLNTGELVLLQQSKDGFYSSTIAAK